MFCNVFRRALMILLASFLILVFGSGCGLRNRSKSQDQPFTNAGDVSPIPEAAGTTPEEFDPTNYASNITYDNLARTPDDYKGKRFAMSGRVIQVVEDDRETTLRIATEGSYGDVILAHFKKSIIQSRILEDDKISFYGLSQGVYTYQSTLGGRITVPLVYVEQFVQGSVSKSSVVFNAEEIAKALDVQELHCTSSYNRWVFLIIKNTSEFTIEISGSLETFDVNGKILSHNDSSEEAVAPGTETILVFLVDEKFASTKYEISVSEEEYYEPVTQNLTYTSSQAKDKEVVTVTNNGSIAARFVKGHSLFFKGDVIVYYNSTYFKDDDSEIKPGKSITKEIRSYENYDTARIIFTGRGR